MTALPFKTFEILNAPRPWTLPLRIGWAISLLAHFTLAVAFTLITIRPAFFLGTPAEKGWGPVIDPNQIVHLKLPPLPPPVMSQVQQTPASTMRSPSALSEISSSARGEPNTNPSGRSRLPKSSGASPEIPERLATESAPPGPVSPQLSSGKDKAGEVVRPSSTPAPREPTKSEQPTLKSPAPGANKPKPEEVAAALRNAQLDRSQEMPALNNPQSSVTAQGAISLDTKGVGEFEQYRAYIVRAIQQHWAIPVEANLLRSPVPLVVVFEVARDGQLLEARIRQSSGVPVLDRAAIRAIQMAAPFRPLPSVFLYPSQVFTDTFTYYPPPQGK